MADLKQLTVLTPEDYRKAYLRVVRNALIQRGVPKPNVTDGSDYSVRAEALSQQLAVPTANALVVADQLMPDTATGQNLIRVMSIYGLAPRVAQGSNGPVVYSSSASGLVTLGATLYDGRGQTFAVSIGGTYSNGDEIPITAVSTGKGTNHEAGDVLQWTSAPPFANSTVTVAVGGLTDGIDDDTEQVSQRRLLAHLQNTAGGGNWAQIKEWAEQSNAAVFEAFVFPALNGPSSYGVWVLGELIYDATTGFSRQITDSTRQKVASYVVGRMPAEENQVMPTLGANVVDVPTDVSIGLTLPASTTAVPPGPGGGWIDAIPWPELAGGATRVYVSSVASPTSFVLTSNVAGSCPTSTDIVDGLTRIAWFDAQSFAGGGPAIKTSTIVSHSGSTGAITVHIDPQNPFSGIAVGNFVFPTAERIETYAQTWLASMSLLGPGEWTSDANYLPRARRRPLTSQSSPSDLTALQTRDILNAGTEILDALYLYRSVSTPGLPTDTTTKAPKVLVPGTFGFYAQ